MGGKVNRGKRWLQTRLPEIQKDTDEYRSKNAFRDQEFAKAYEESGCTQREIAEVHGCSQSTVNWRVRFGRFLRFLITSVIKVPLRTLTEGSFRRAWSETSRNAGEEPRFEQAVEILADPQKPNDVADRISSTYRKGQWFTPEEFHEASGIRLRTVKQTLRDMVIGKTGLCVLDTKLIGKNVNTEIRQYRIRERIKQKQQVYLSEFVGLVADLERELKNVLGVVVGKSWVSTGPAVIESELSLMRKRLREARAFIKEKENSPRTAPGDARHGQRGIALS